MANDPIPDLCKVYEYHGVLSHIHHLLHQWLHVVVVQEIPSPEAAAEESAAEEAASEKGFVETIRDAFASGEKGAIAEAEAQLQGIEADRKGLAETVKALEEEIAKSKDRYGKAKALKKVLVNLKHSCRVELP